MEKLTQSKETYDKIFAEGGYEGSYNLPYWQSAYYPLFKAVLAKVLSGRVKSVLEVGCGTGGFAGLVRDKSSLNYRGFDFSEVAVEKARARVGQEDLIYVGDATLPSSYAGKGYDCIVCTEVLEHIEKDLETIANWKPGVFCVCSVPSFDSETHVRFFRSEVEVEDRYGKLIEIESMVCLKKPVLSNISLANTLREVRWNRYRPRQLMAIMGLGSFESLGGWSLFAGTKRP